MSKSQEFILNKDKYKAAELKTLHQIIFPNHKVELSNEFDRYDCAVPELKVLIELKNRDFDSDFFDKNYDGEMLLEKHKCDSMLELIKTDKFKGYKACYLYYFTDNTYQYVVLNNLDFTRMSVKKMYLPRNSFVKNSGKVLKEVYIIPKRLLNKTNYKRDKIKKGSN